MADRRGPGARGRFQIAALAVAFAACAGDPPKAAVAAHGPLAALMTQHTGAICAVSSRSYETKFWSPPYQSCGANTADSAETAELDADSLVVELYNTWELTPANHASAFSQAESELVRQFGNSRRCGAGAVEWRHDDSLHIVLQVKPVSDVGTEFDEGPWRMTRIARLGPLDARRWGC